MALSDAAGGINNAIREQLMARFAQQQYQDRLAQQQVENDLRERQFQSNEELKRAQLSATAANQHAMDQDRDIQRGVLLNDSIPAKTKLGADSPAVPYLQRAGADLTHNDPTMASTEIGGFSSLPGASKPTGRLMTTSRAAEAESYTKGASAKQQDTLADNERQANAEADRIAREKARDAEIARHNHAEENKPQGGAEHFQLQPEIDPKTGAQTGRFLGYNTKTNSFTPIEGVTPQSTKAAPGAGQAAQGERAKTEALASLSQLDQAIEDAKDLVGPGAGRISSLEQMAGSADPRIQRLNAKMKAVKMQVDHAITGSVRAGASPKMMEQWDNILANKVDPAGLKAGVQAMREILGGGEARAAAPAAGGGKTYHLVNGQWVAQ
jgi:hypothetical protein